MDVESDVAEFLAREKEELGDLNEFITDNVSSGEEFVMVENDNQNEDSFEGMEISGNANIIHELPEKIRIWREQNIKMLEEKDASEKNAIEQLREASKQELEDWYNNNKRSLDKVKAMNRENESSELETTKEMSDTQLWESISNLCDFSHSKISKNRDVSRMKSIFLQMKQNKVA